MQIGIIGAGNMGIGLGRFWVGNGHQLMLAFSKDKEKLLQAASALGKDVRTGTPAEAAAFGEVVLLATPYTISAEALRAAGPLDSKILFSCVNALKPDLSGMAVGTTSSAAEELAKLVPKARFVEALPRLPSYCTRVQPNLADRHPPSSTAEMTKRQKRS